MHKTTKMQVVHPCPDDTCFFSPVYSIFFLPFFLVKDLLWKIGQNSKSRYLIRSSGAVVPPFLSLFCSILTKFYLILCTKLQKCRSSVHVQMTLVSSHLLRHFFSYFFWALAICTGQFANKLELVTKRKWLQVLFFNLLESILFQ